MNKTELGQRLVKIGPVPSSKINYKVKSWFGALEVNCTDIKSNERYCTIHFFCF
jgi:hypothetical protein